MDKTLNKRTGGLGEDLAFKFLLRKGYKVLERNFKTRFGEIDLICVKDKKLIFVEVKAKVGDRFGSPEEMINGKKIGQIIRTAQSFLLKNRSTANKYPVLQIDAICIVLKDDNSIERIDHYENINN